MKFITQDDIGYNPSDSARQARLFIDGKQSGYATFQQAGAINLNNCTISGNHADSHGGGASSRPTGGYDTGSMTQDITAVLDSLGIRRATFAGHSFAGTELSYLGAFHADRVAQLIYLDSSYDFARLYAEVVVQFPSGLVGDAGRAGVRSIRCQC